MAQGLTENATTENDLSDWKDKLGYEREECSNTKDVVVDISSNDFEKALRKKGNLELYEEQISSR